MAKRKYLITGGYGLIGSTLANSLSGDVTILTRSDKHKERITKTDVVVITKDLHDVSKEDIEGHDVVYHCASTVDNYHVLSDPYLDVETNVKGTIKLLEACKDLAKKPKIVFFSTFFVYGNEYDRTRIPINEESKTEPLALYPITKLATESTIKLYSRLYSVPYLILRLTNVYDEHEEYDNKKKGIMNWLVMRAVRGEPLPIYRGGNFVRDYIYLDDVISAVMFLEDKDITNNLFLVGTGKPVKFRDMIDYILELTNKKSRINEIEPPEFHKAVGMTNFVADTSKINNLGWKSEIGYREGLQRIVDNYKKINDKNQ